MLTAVNQSIATGQRELAAAKANKTSGPNPQLYAQGSLDLMIAAVTKINELKGQLTALAGW